MCSFQGKIEERSRTAAKAPSVDLLATTGLGFCWGGASVTNLIVAGVLIGANSPRASCERLPTRCFGCFAAGRVRTRTLADCTVIVRRGVTS